MIPYRAAGAPSSRPSPQWGEGVRGRASLTAHRPWLICLLILLAANAVSPARADDYFSGKEINLYVGSSPGGPYDAYARLLARHLGRHIPGHPGVVVQNMPGASGRRLMGFIYNVAPRDGTAIATAQRALAFDPLMGVDSRFDPDKVTWIGSANNETNVCMVWHSSPIRTLDDVKTRDMVVGTSGPSSTDAIYPNVMNALFGTRFRVVGGYQAAAESNVAMERGEIDGRCGITWDTLVSLNADWLRDKKIRLLVQFALERSSDLPDVPSVFDLARTDEERQILALWAAPNKMGRPFFAPPGMAPDRVDLLRRAFDAALQDPALLAEAGRMQLAIAGITGEQVQALIRQLYATPKDVVAKAALAGRGR
jgi:tripartite-type tricarboxylate transporter receptor subunit TctC